MKSVIITGANRGIGLDTTIAFAKAGYKVFATMRNPKNAQELMEKVRKPIKGNLLSPIPFFVPSLLWRR